MRKLIAYALAGLLFVVAFAGLSPPTKKQEKQNVIASTSYAEPVVAVEVRDVQATSRVENKIIADTVAAILTDTNVQKNEVAARARSGVSEAPMIGVNHQTPCLRFEADIGTVLLL